MKIYAYISSISHRFNFKINVTLALKFSFTEIAEAVQLINIRPTVRVGCTNPNRAITLAPAPSPSPMTYRTCNVSSTVTKSSPRVCKLGYWYLYRDDKLRTFRLRMNL